ncbi:acyl-CoA thioesterase/bile acid-CoA:amino acid N-acyltransferase family protein [Kitasatospora sp. NPDC049285]|uniref:acyl-CoA thioesterase/bile acid-CoA:amino acid N-acyltransferase family protein n=1 Tax=Kitasatospora sp. NPDC049285 TaxID=3157096 RepID=UPI003449EE59
MIGTIRRAAGAGLAALLLAASAACTSDGTAHQVVLTVDNATADNTTALADQRVHLRVTGLKADQPVTLTAEADDYGGNRWRSTADFRADGAGDVDLDRAVPTGGTYHQADGMGLFWSMKVDGAAGLFQPGHVGSTDTSRIRITVRVADRAVADRTVIRSWVGDGVTVRQLTMAADKMIGRLYLPPAGSAPKAPVLLLGGSEGGIGLGPTAELLAAHGHPALALAYFGLSGLPPTLQDVPVEYAAAAAGLLAALPGTDPSKLAVIGYSRGSELALLTAQNRPDLVHRVVVYAPSAQVNPGLGGGVAWTLGGAPVPAGPIPTDRIGGPLLALAGADDQLWPSERWARQLGAPSPAAPLRQVVVYPAAGHSVGTYPYLPSPTTVTTIQRQVLALGGTDAGNEAAQVDGWAKVLALLDS